MAASGASREGASPVASPIVTDTLARVSRRVPVQKRSKERFEKVLAAAGELIAEQGADHVGMRELADSSGVPVATIYQYFGNREAVIATFFERESEKLDLAMANAFLELKRVDLKTVVETISDVHVKHHRENPAAVSVWFSGRAGFEVADRIRKQHTALGAWLRDGLVRAGLMRPDAPEDCCALIVRLFDRTFELKHQESSWQRKLSALSSCKCRRGRPILLLPSVPRSVSAVSTSWNFARRSMPRHRVWSQACLFPW